MADTFFSIPDKDGNPLNHRSATNGSSYQHPATSLFLFGGGTPVEVGAAAPVYTRQTGAVFNADLTVDTSIYAAGDSLCTLLTVTGAVLVAGETAVLNYVHLVDAADQGPAIRVYVFDRSVTLPSNNAAWNVSDADMKYSRAMIQVLAGDWSDAGGNRTATFSGLGIPIKPNSGTSIYMGAIVDGTPTFAAATDLNITIGFKY
jgi:hypothetical protein